MKQVFESEEIKHIFLKIESFIISIVLLLTILCSFSGCSSEPQRIELTEDNFDEYFVVNTEVINFKTHAHGGNVILGYAMPRYFSGEADVRVTVTAKKPFSCDSVSLSLRCTCYGRIIMGEINPDPQKIQLVIPADASSVNKELHFESKDVMNPIEEYAELKSAYTSLESVSGFIIID